MLAEKFPESGQIPKFAGIFGSISLMHNQKRGDMPLWYKALKGYIRTLYENVFYKDVVYIGTENIPSDGTPLMVVSDHQNSLNDSLGILLSFRDRLVHFIVRADVFSLSTAADKFLRSIGLLPAYRMNFEGEEALGSNQETFRDAEEALLSGDTVVIFPEAGHQDHHHLGTFSYGYTRMAFGAAERGGFEKEIFILPSANHYDDYFGMRRKQLVMYGSPISLKPYYELYKTKPRTAQRQVNALVRAQIEGMMLDVRDEEHYSSIWSALRSFLGRRYCHDKGLDPDNLTDKLQSDKELAAKMEAAGDESFYESMDKYGSALDSLGASEKVYESKPDKVGLAANAVLYLILFPVFVFSLWPTVVSYFLPKHFIDKVGDKMLSGSFYFALNVLFILPLLGLLTFVVALCIGMGFIRSVVWVLLLPFLCWFCWQYVQWLRELRQGWRVASAAREKLSELASLREELSERMDGIVKTDDAADELEGESGDKE